MKHRKSISMMVGMVLAGTLLLSCHHREQAAPINYKLIPFATEDGLFGYMEPDGDIAIEPQYEGAQVFANGVACVCINGEYGYISEEGMVVIPAIYEQGTSFSNNLAFVRVKQDHFICIDTDGRMKFEITNCVAVRPFSEGMAPFCSVLGKWGYMNDKGEEVYIPTFDYAGDFHEGVAAVQMHGKWGMIDTEGEFVVEPIYSSLGFEEGKANE